MTTDRVTVYVLKPKDRPFYKLEWVEPGTDRRRSVSAKTADPAEAERKRADKEYELNHGLYREASRLGWDQFRAIFEAEYVAGQRPRSREKYTTVFDVFEQVVRPAKLRDVSERALSQFVKGMRERKQPRKNKVGLAPMTMKNYLLMICWRDWRGRQHCQAG